MPIQVELIKENRAVLQTYSDPLTNTDLNQLKNQMVNKILPAATGKLHVIADLRDIRNLPGTILNSGSSMLRTPHMNTGLVICVTSHAFINAMAHILAKLVPKQQVKVVQSLEEAYKAVDALLVEVN